jgi:hypothetical protein
MTGNTAKARRLRQVSAAFLFSRAPQSVFDLENNPKQPKSRPLESVIYEMQIS